MDDTRDEVGEILAGMTGGRTGTAGGVSSPVPPAADWPRGLDAASASAARLTVLLSDVYKAHQGKEPSASLAAQIEQTVRNLTGEPPQEPEYGPGLWTAMPQRSWETMGMARPIDWTGAPSRTEIDLMTMHAIRYGEWELVKLFVFGVCFINKVPFVRGMRPRVGRGPVSSWSSCAPR